MEEKKESTTVCTSIFKSGKRTTTEEEFTKKWIELINTLEKDSQFIFEDKT